MRFIRKNGHIIPISDSKGKLNSAGKAHVRERATVEAKANKVAKTLYAVGGAVAAGAAMGVLHGQTVKSRTIIRKSSHVLSAAVALGYGAVLAGFRRDTANGQKHAAQGDSWTASVKDHIKYSATDTATLVAAAAAPYVAVRLTAKGMKGWAGKVKAAKAAAQGAATVMKTPFSGPLKNVTPLIKRLAAP